LQPTPPAAPELIDELVVGNRILFRQNIVDAFGHLSVRHDKDPQKYLMARHLAPGLVTAADIVTFDLDSVPQQETPWRYYSERFIHGEIYKIRPDVVSICHCHTASLIPFANTKVPLMAMYHVSAFLGTGVGVFDIRDKAGMTSMLVRTPELGRDLAAALGEGPMILMRGHGATMVGKSIKETVYRSIYAAQNAAIQLDALRLADLGGIRFLAPEEAEKYEAYGGEVIDRPWNLWAREAQREG
jgi:ribulose-5-phosphate 4-epimerase/fuculose-1-phosphate aldolase